MGKVTEVRRYAGRNKTKLLKLTLMANKQLTIEELELKAKEIRRLIIQMLVKAGSGHPEEVYPPPDLITALYYNVLNFKSNDPQWPDAAVFICLKGIAARCGMRY